MAIKVRAKFGSVSSMGNPNALPLEQMFAAAITQVGQKVQKHAVDRMRLEAERIRDLAISYAPVETHNLEEAIKVGEDAQGLNRRKRFFVYIDDNADLSGNKPVGVYAKYMHENPYKLGKASIVKDAGRGVVGPKFLYRATKERAKEVEKSIYNAVKEALQ